MRRREIALIVAFVAGFSIIVLLKVKDLINGQAAVFLFLSLLVVVAYFRDGRELPYRELTDITF